MSKARSRYSTWVLFSRMHSHHFVNESIIITIDLKPLTTGKFSIKSIKTISPGAVPENWGSGALTFLWFLLFLWQTRNFPVTMSRSDYVSSENYIYTTTNYRIFPCVLKSSSEVNWCWRIMRSWNHFFLKRYLVVHMRGKVAFHLNFLPSPIIYKLNHILSEAYEINDKINVKMWKLYIGLSVLSSNHDVTGSRNLPELFGYFYSKVAWLALTHIHKVGKPNRYLGGNLGRMRKFLASERKFLG